MARKRHGCLGLLLISAIAAGVLVLIAPWSIHTGGRWTFLGWSGVAQFHGTNGDHYAMYVWFGPDVRHGRVSAFRTRLPRYNLRGQAYLCTAQGPIYKFRLSGGIFGVWLDTDGGDVSFYITDPQNRLWRSLEFSGTWHGAELVMEDNGSFDRSFRTDGSLKPRKGAWPTPGHEQRASGTFTWGSYSDFENVCRSEFKK